MQNISKTATEIGQAVLRDEHVTREELETLADRSLTMPGINVTDAVSELAERAGLGTESKLELRRIAFAKRDPIDISPGADVKHVKLGSVTVMKYLPPVPEGKVIVVASDGKEQEVYRSDFVREAVGMKLKVKYFPYSGSLARSTEQEGEFWIVDSNDNDRKVQGPYANTHDAEEALKKEGSFKSAQDSTVYEEDEEEDKELDEGAMGAEGEEGAEGVEEGDDDEKD